MVFTVDERSNATPGDAGCDAFTVVEVIAGVQMPVTGLQQWVGAGSTTCAQQGPVCTAIKATTKTSDIKRRLIGHPPDRLYIPRRLGLKASSTALSLSSSLSLFVLTFVFVVGLLEVEGPLDGSSDSIICLRIVSIEP